jgi:formate-dependent nitrite reductase membrane component NrfD
VENRYDPLKKPVWTWEVPAYFFVGGAAGAAAVIAALASVHADHATIARHARLVAAAGAAIAPILLIADLGRPARFLNMLRIFKPQSPMSVGAWTLAVFSIAAFASLGVHEFARPMLAVLPDAWLDAIGAVAAIVAALSGLVLATYTGVLIGVTAIPVWAAHVRLLPVLFGLSGLGSAISIIELLGDRTAALNTMGLIVAAGETVLFVMLERRTGADTRPIKRGLSGALVRSAGVLSGPVALVLRLAATRSIPLTRVAAAISMIAGSALARYGWLAAGRVSAQDSGRPRR